MDDKELNSVIRIIEKSNKRLLATALDVRELPDKVGHGDPDISADQIDREVDNLEEAREMLVTGRGTGNE